MNLEETVKCACGCETDLVRWVDYGGNKWPSQIKERKYVHGHNKPWLGKKLPEHMRRAISKRQAGRKRGPHTEETKRKISKSNKGQVPWNKGVSSPAKKRVYQRRKCLECKAEIGNGNRSGYCRKHSTLNKRENHYNWKGGVTPVHEIERRSGSYAAWRVNIFERDRYTCQSCGVRGTVLHAHHIKSFSKHPSLRMDLENGITLCKECHLNAHRKS